MGEPQEKLHSYASVADWVATTSLAQYDNTAAAPEPAEDDPDAFYRPSAHLHSEQEASHYSENMTTTRQRQQSANGNIRSTPKPAFRSASGPPTSSTPGTRSAAQLPGSRPSVKAIAQKFNQAPSSTESSPSIPRARPSRVASSVRSTTSPPVRQVGHAASAARPAKEASYGPHKFNNLKTRERPQPAPASPANLRRANGGRSGLDDKASPMKAKVTSPSRGHKHTTSASRAPFFGEVVGEHDASTPGYGIPTVDTSSADCDPSSSQQAGASTIKMVQDVSTLGPIPDFSASSPLHHRRSPSDLGEPHANDGFVPRSYGPSHSRQPRRRSPPSRIPVPTRRMSAASDSSSSSRSFGTGLANKISSVAPPGRRRQIPGYTTTGPPPISSQDAALAALAYKELMNTGRSPKALMSAGVDLPGLTPASPRNHLPLGSPRLRHSNERQFPHHASPETGPGLPGRHLDTGAGSTAGSPFDNSKSNERSGQPLEEARNKAIGPTTSASVRLVQALEHDFPSSPQDPLTLRTSNLQVPKDSEPVSATTEFEYEESPVLGMPGSFMMTPPIAQTTPQLGSEEVEDKQLQYTPMAEAQPELLQARAFQPPSKERNVTPNTAVQPADPSVLGVQESIPIMLGEDDQQPGWGVSPTRSRQSPRLNIGAQKWRTQPLDSSGTIAFIEDEDSPIDPFAHRGTLHPDDSASVAFYQQFRPPLPESKYMPSRDVDGRLTLDSHAYSVINKVLNLYHESDAVTPTMATDSQQQVLGVSPAIAQHTDWGSKEATETYLARLLSDASEHVHTEQNDPVQEADLSRNPPMPALNIDQFDEEPSDFEAGGTAIIFPSESRRYSRGSGGSSTTMIWEDGSRPDSSSGSVSRDRGTQGETPASIDPSLAPHPPPKDGRYSPSPNNFYRPGDQSRAGIEHTEAPYSSLLPKIESTGEGLGLSLQAGQNNDDFTHTQPPPRPQYSPPPPPLPPSIDQTSALSSGTATPSTHTQRPSSSGYPSSQLPALSPGSPTAGSWLSTLRGRPKDDPNKAPPLPSAPTSARKTPHSSDGPVPPRLLQRYNIVREFVETEKLYSTDMMVADCIFQHTAMEILTEKERRTLFSNVHEISKFAHQLFRDLKRTCRPVIHQDPKLAKDGQQDTAEKAPIEEDNEFLLLTEENDRKIQVGAVMNEAMPRLERLYTTYLLNHDDANEYIRANLKNPKILGWVMACIKHSKGLTNAWDLDSLLVKPTQRMMKYPLLLGELLKVTEPDHPDYDAIKAAFAEVAAINERINQAKRRQETLREATKEGKKQKSRGLFDSRLGKNFVKALTSKSDRVKMQAGAAEVFDDPEYNKLAQKFGGHFFQLQIVMRDVEKYLEDISIYMASLNATIVAFITLLDSAPSSCPEIESTWRRQAMALYELQTVALEDHKSVVKLRIIKPISELWNLHNRPQKLMEQRKKGLPHHVKFTQAMDKKEKIDTKLQDASEQFLIINNTLKLELPKLYAFTKKCVIAILESLVTYQKDWWKNSQKKILPLLEVEPEHTTSIHYDLEKYVERFRSDYTSVLGQMNSLAIVNRTLLSDSNSLLSPTPTLYSDDTSSRKSSSRRTESMSSDMSGDTRRRRSGGYATDAFENARSAGKRFYPPQRDLYSDSPGRGERSLSPISDKSDDTVKVSRQIPNMDGVFDDYDPFSAPTSNPGSSRTSTVFNSALPMSDSPIQTSSAEGLAGGPDSEDVEVLFLAASLFEFNIAHDRREGGIPYLVYVPGEIFDVIGLKGELWLARNQDDPSKTIGWIWEKHFARILPEEA